MADRTKDRYSVSIRSPGGTDMLPLLLLSLSGLADASTCSNNWTGDLACDGSVLSERVWGYPNLIGTHTCNNRTATVNGGENFYEFICPYDGPVSFELYNPVCDVDMFLYDAPCPTNSATPGAGTCLDRNVDGVSAGPVVIDVDCVEGESYWIVIDAYAPFHDPLGGNCAGGQHPDGLGPFGFSFFSDFEIAAVCEEICGDGFDNDGNGDIDCADSACPCVEDCSTPGDENFNGLADCDDPQCATSVFCQEDCDTPGDEDGNGLSDCLDPACTCVEDCDTPGDEDLNGVADCFDPACDCVEDCDTPGDEDFNGLADCMDPTCTCVEDCSTPGDEDFNGLSDCADPTCSGTALCCDIDGDGAFANTAACGFGGDCDDSSPAIRPTATEIVADGIDQDCDGGDTCWADADFDSYGSTDTVASPDLSCAEAGESDNDDDCRDEGPGASQVNPLATEIVGDDLDQDCDGVDTCFRDQDGDGAGTSQQVPGDDLTCGDSPGRATNDLDCLDTGPNAASTFPGAPETCNQRDDDCDGLIDDEDDDTIGQSTWWLDADGDGFAGNGQSVDRCVAPADSYPNRTDCDDARDDVFPGAPEICNLTDDDCDNLVDDDDDLADALFAYPDADGDGFGAATGGQLINNCTIPDGWAGQDGDCDDADGNAYPGASELPYDTIDQDCDGSDLDDVDGDGVPGGLLGLDCADNDASRFPGVAEIRDGIDQDCDGLVDEGTDAVDDDGDGYAELGGDCDDTNPTIHPGATEVADGVDQDCNGDIDDRTEVWDHDGDTVSIADGDCNDGDPAVSPLATEIPGNGIDDDCSGDAVAGDEDGDGYAVSGGDCDDTSASVYPGAPERINGIDNDCDGVADNGTKAFDNDGDGLAEDAGDCDDTNPSINPSAVELPTNRIDDNCNGVVDEGGPQVDDDGDGWSDEAGDCDDTSAGISPSADDILDGIDNDCDGIIDGGTDVDGDGWTPAAGDCDDSDGWANPEATEVCDLVDNDCNDLVDEGCGDDGPITVEPTPEDPKGCACDGGGTTPGLLSLLLLLGLRRRR